MRSQSSWRALSQQLNRYREKKKEDNDDRKTLTPRKPDPPHVTGVHAQPDEDGSDSGQPGNQDNGQVMARLRHTVLCSAELLCGQRVSMCAVTSQQLSG